MRASRKILLQVVAFVAIVQVELVVLKWQLEQNALRWLRERVLQGNINLQAGLEVEVIRGAQESPPTLLWLLALLAVVGFGVGALALLYARRWLKEVKA